MTRFVQLSDIHLQSDPDALLHGVNTSKALQRAIDAVKQLKTVASAVIITGDLVMRQSTEAYQRLRPLLQQLAMPVYVLPGNHDDVDKIKSILCGENIYYEPMVSFSHWSFVFVNTKLDGERYGFVNDTELSQLKDNLESCKNQPTVVAFHHPPVAQCPLDGCQLQNGDVVMATLEQYPNIHAVLAGHIHMASHSTHKHIQQFVAPSTFCQAVHGNWQGGELTQAFWDNHKLDNSKQGFRIFDIQPHGEINSEVVWI